MYHRGFHAFTLLQLQRPDSAIHGDGERDDVGEDVSALGHAAPTRVSCSPKSQGVSLASWNAVKPGRDSLSLSQDLTMPVELLLIDADSGGLVASLLQPVGV